jgi:ElaB/YqjD/DUF883 family membrane-anchored ribosome-binding protein
MNNFHNVTRSANSQLAKINALVDYIDDLLKDQDLVTIINFDEIKSYFNAKSAEDFQRLIDDAITLLQTTGRMAQAEHKRTEALVSNLV